jgi:voltage-gated potassium channel Kch
MRFGVRRLERAFETGRILPFLMLVIAALAFVAGAVMWIVDGDDFPTLGLALWWAVTTVTTVGYGDVVPTDAAGRFVAAGLMIAGYASLSLLTGVIASLLVSRRAAALEAAEEQALEKIDRRLAEVERLLRAQSRGVAE